MEKRGLQHVEFIVAFVIFAGFLVFALYFFSPVRGDRIVDSTLFYTLDEVANNASTELETFSVSVDQNVPDKIAIPLLRHNVGIRVEDSEGNRLEAQAIDGYVHIDRGNGRFFIIMFNEDYDNGFVQGAVISEDNYSISSSDKRSVLSEKKFSELVERYATEEGYQELRKSFHLAKRANFGFSLVFSPEDKLEAQRDVPEGLEVFSDSKRYEVVRESGTEFADLEVRVW